MSMSAQVFNLISGTTMLQLGEYLGKPAVFIRERFINDPVDNYNLRREVWDMAELTENEQVLIVETREQARELLQSLSALRAESNKTAPVIIYPDPSMSYDNHG